MHEYLEAGLAVLPTATVRDAMEAISASRKGVIAVVDLDGVLLGVLSDGDIRRGMLRGTTTFAPVEKIMNTHPVTVEKEEDAAGVFRSRPEVSLLPLIDTQGKVVRIILRDNP